MSEVQFKGYMATIMADPSLANARRKLSFDEIYRIARHASAPQSDMLEALNAILREPYGCVFCDSGKLRNPNKPHEPNCGFLLGEAILAKACAS